MSGDDEMGMIEGGFRRASFLLKLLTMEVTASPLNRTKVHDYGIVRPLLLHPQ